MLDYDSSILEFNSNTSFIFKIQNDGSKMADRYKKRPDQNEPGTQGFSKSLINLTSNHQNSKWRIQNGGLICKK